MTLETWQEESTVGKQSEKIGRKRARGQLTEMKETENRITNTT